MIKPVKDCLFIRWLHSGFYKPAAMLESHSAENFLKESDIRMLMSKKYGMGGFVITDVNKTVGYTIYDQSEGVLDIVNLVVHQDYRRRGIASLLLEKLATRSRWHHMETCVRETNLSAQLFFKSKGFLATGVRRRYFQDEYFGENKVEDAYHFRKSRDYE